MDEYIGRAETRRNALRGHACGPSDDVQNTGGRRSVLSNAGAPVYVNWWGGGVVGGQERGPCQCCGVHVRAFQEVISGRDEHHAREAFQSARRPLR